MTPPLRRTLLAATVAAWVASLATVPALADESGWLITSFHSDIHIAADSTLTISEDIQVDFGVLQKHGIFRTIPLRYRYDDSHDRYYTISIDSVTDGSRPIPYNDSVDNDNEVIKIGDPNLLVSGPNRYVITYTLSGVMNAFADHDELYWNVTGASWPVNKRAVSATVFFPAGSFQKAACYEGATGSTESCKFESGDSSVTYTASRELGTGEQLTIVTGLNKGAVSVPPPLLEGRKRSFPRDAFDVTPLTIAISLVVFVGGIGLIARYWWLHGRDREYLTQYYLTNDPREGPAPVFRHDPVVVEFGPPQNLRPATLGVILDESADTKDVTATIVDLAVRGHLTITEVAGKKDWLLTSKTGPGLADLAPFEQSLMNGLFSGRLEVKISQLKGTFQPSLQVTKRLIYSDAMARKLFRLRPDLFRLGLGCAGVLVFLLGAGAAFVLGITLDRKSTRLNSSHRL